MKPHTSATLARLTVAWLCCLPVAATAQARELEVLSPRSLGMGETLRGAAAGSAALFLNPSGISLARSYVIEAGYQKAQGVDGHVAHLAIADSTSAFNLGGGVYYNYATATPPGAPGRGRHEAGAALSFPLGDQATIGGTARYLRTWVDEAAAPAGTPATKLNGFTFDAGLTLRPVRMISLGLVAYGLGDLGTTQATPAFGGGVAVSPTAELLFAADAVSEKLADQRRMTFSGGTEYTFAARLSVRVGGGTVQDGEAFGTAGLTALSEVGALDLGARLDLAGGSESLYFGLGARLFVPTP